VLKASGVVTVRAGLRYPWTNYRANFERREEVIEVESYCNLSVRESLPIRLIRRLKGNASGGYNYKYI
jgi:hypothetical protein